MYTYLFASINTPNTIIKITVKIILMRPSKDRKFQKQKCLSSAWLTWCLLSTQFGVFQKKEACAYQVPFYSSVDIGEYRLRALKNRKGDLKLNIK